MELRKLTVADREIITELFRDVFSRADDNMYSDKNEYYKHNKKLKKTR